VLQGAFDSFAMGNYPYPSSYMGGELPAWPMRAACERLASPSMSSSKLLKACPCFPLLACFGRRILENSAGEAALLIEVYKVAFAQL